MKMTTQRMKKEYQTPVTKVVNIRIHCPLLSDSGYGTEGISGTRQSYKTETAEDWD